MDNMFENQYAPDFVSPPGETLIETIQALGMSQAELAERTGRPRKTINEIATGKAAITADTALQFERVLGAPASFWISRETNYREFLACRAEAARLKKQVRWLDCLPVTQMCDLGWIHRYEDPVMQLREVLTYFAVATPEAWHRVWHGAKSPYGKSEFFANAPGAVSAWLRKGEIEARNLECAPFDRVAFTAELKVIRELATRPSPDATVQIRYLCAKAGVAVVFVDPLPNAKVCGATHWLGTQKAVIQLSNSHETLDKLLFALIRQAVHIIKHGKRTVLLDPVE